MSDTRPLTEGEIELAQSIYGDAIDYSKVEIHDDNYPFLPDDRAHAPDGDMYFPGNTYEEDFSEAGLRDRETFIHELGHVLQHQNGVWVKTTAVTDAITGNGGYDWEDEYAEGSDFSDWGLEEQAQFFSDLYVARETGRTPDGVTHEQMEELFQTLDLTDKDTFASLDRDLPGADGTRLAGLEGGAPDAAALGVAPQEVALQDAVAWLEAGRAEMDAAYQGGARSLAHQAVSHQGCWDMLDALGDKGVGTLDAELSPDMDVETRVQALVLAGVESAKANGIEIPGYTSQAHEAAHDTAHASAHESTHDAGRDMAHADESFDYDFG